MQRRLLAKTKTDKVNHLLKKSKYITNSLSSLLSLTGSINGCRCLWQCRLQRHLWRQPKCGQICWLWDPKDSHDASALDQQLSSTIEAAHLTSSDSLLQNQVQQEGHDTLGNRWRHICLVHSERWTKVLLRCYQDPLWRGQDSHSYSRFPSDQHQEGLDLPDLLRHGQASPSWRDILRGNIRKLNGCRVWS